MWETESPWLEHLLSSNKTSTTETVLHLIQLLIKGTPQEYPKQPKLLWRGRFLSKKCQQSPMERQHSLKDGGAEFVLILNFHPYIFSAGRYSTCSQMRNKNTKPDPNTLSTMVSNL